MRYKSLFCDRGINDSCIRFFIIQKVLNKNKIFSSIIKKQGGNLIFKEGLINFSI